MLKVEDLVVHYGRVPAVHGITLHVGEGELVGLIGPNGAGKSTTLAAITGLVKPSSGTIGFAGEDLVGQPPERIVRQGLALVPEGRHIFGSLTVEENLILGALARTDRSGSEEELASVLERFPILKHYFKAPAGKLSGGEQQQLAIGRALLSKPRLLLLDEPSLGLAPLVVDQVFEVLDDLRSQGITILLVEQNAARTVELADRTYVLRTGSIATSGTREELHEAGGLMDAYLGI
ncbi:MAG: branched-chain amino acid transport system ATP-binding protein [Baekduia sp.]|nr:branched-chain amino acid transport system ATP-binding protein [Baekduia sp.]